MENTINMTQNQNGVFEAANGQTINTNLFNWEVLTGEVYDRNGQRLENYKHLYRSDNGQTLNIANKTYTPTTNARFSESVNRLAKATGFEVAQFGEVKEGKKVMAFLKAPQGLQIAGVPHEMYLMLGNSHDGSTAYFVGQTSHMIRCANQFTQQNQRLKAYHTSGNDGQIFHIEQSMQGFNDMQKSLKQSFEALERKKATPKDRTLLIRELLDIPTNAKAEDISSRKQNQIVTLNESFNRETADLGNNLFGLFNGVTHYTTHARKSKNKTFGNVHGTDFNLNRKAFNIVNELLSH